jgi:hypothetical protein
MPATWLTFLGWALPGAPLAPGPSGAGGPADGPACGKWGGVVSQQPTTYATGRLEGQTCPQSALPNAAGWKAHLLRGRPPLPAPLRVGMRDSRGRPHTLPAHLAHRSAACRDDRPDPSRGRGSGRERLRREGCVRSVNSPPCLMRKVAGKDAPASGRAVHRNTGPSSALGCSPGSCPPCCLERRWHRARLVRGVQRRGLPAATGGAWSVSSPPPRS